MGSFQHGAVSRTLLLLLSVCALGLSSDYTRAAPEPRVLSACEDPADFSAGRAPDEPGFEFAAWEATVFPGARVKGSSLRWHVRPSSASQTSARLALTRTPAEMPQSVSVWVKNPNAHDLLLHLEIIDADGATYLSPPADLLDETGWHEIVFELSSMTAQSGDPAPGIDAPIVRIAFVLDGLSVDRPHTIYLDEITAELPEREALTVTNLRCQTSLGPGEPLPTGAEITPAATADGAHLFAELASMGGGVVAWTPAEVADNGGGTATVRATLRVPDWVAPGRYEVRLGGDVGQGAGADPVGVVIGGAPPSPTQATIAAGLAPPAIALEGANHRPVVEELRGSLPAELSEDVTIVGLPATTDRHPFAWAPPAVADDAGTLDFSGLDRRAAAVLTARPQAALLLQVFIDASPEWEDTNPEHLVQYDGDSLAPMSVIAGDRRHPDIVSEAWQTSAEQRLRALVQHVEGSPWSHRVIGYELQAGDMAAWRPWGASLGVGDDVTRVRKQEFLAWLNRHYTDVNDLRDNWLGRRRGFGRPRAGFESVEIPTPLANAPEPSLYDPAADRPMIDLQYFKAEMPADALIAMANAVREEAGAGTLVGGCYGHLLSQARANDWSWPHTALTHVLESEALDFLTGPQARIDDPAQPSSLGDSVRRAGQLYLERTNGADAVAEDCGALVPAGTAGELTHLPSPDTPSPGPAVVEVVDDVSARYLSGGGQLPRELLTRPISGSIVHQTHLLRDFLQPNPPAGRLYVFRDVFTIAPEDGRLLARVTCRDKSLLVWVYAPGAVDKHLITGRTMQYLTGIKLSPLLQRGTVTVTPEAGLIPQFGLPYPISPLFVSVDEEAEWLGTVGSGDPERCGFALREFPNCTSVFSLAPPTEQVMRHLAKRSSIEITPLP